MDSLPDNPNKSHSSHAGGNLRRIAQAASQVDVSNPANLKNQEGFTDKKGRWVRFSEE